MLTKKERDFVEYCVNYKPDMPPYKEKEYLKDKKVKHTKKLKKEKKSYRDTMEEIRFELGLDEEELDDLLIPEEEWDDLEE